MYGCESWTIKKTECWRIDAFELWCWSRFLRVPWTARRSNQSILKKISPEHSLAGLMMTLKLQYFGHLIWRANPLEKTLMLGKMKVGGEGDDRRWDGWMASPTWWTWVCASSEKWWRTGKAGVLLSWGHKGLDTAERLNNNKFQQKKRKLSTSFHFLPDSLQGILPVGKSLVSEL